MYLCIRYLGLLCLISKKKMDINLRKSILKTAEGLFTKYGIKSIKVDDICNELHISKKTFYTEFENKEALIGVVYDSISEKTPSRFDLGGEVDSCVNAIDLWFKRPSMAVRDHHKKYELFMYDLLKFYPQVRASRLEDEKKKVSEVIKALLNKGIEQGFFREDLNIDYMIEFSHNINQMAVDKLLHLPKNEHVSYVLFLLDMWIRMVCNENGLAYYNANYENGIKK